MKRSIALWAPLGLFIALAVAFVVGLRGTGDTVHPSALVGQTIPTFALPAVSARPALSSRDLASGRPHLVNIFASWCVPCAAEAPQLAAIAAAGVPVVGIAIRDRRDAVSDFLARNGNPYTRIGGDATSKVQMALGSSGVPETFVVDGQGVIRLQKIGPIMPGEEAAIVAAVAAAR